MSNDFMKSPLQYLPFESLIDSSFWYKLRQLKLELYRLDETDVPIWGYYLIPQHPIFKVDYSSMEGDADQRLSSLPQLSLYKICKSPSSSSEPLLLSPGYVINLNSLENFKSYDKNKLIAAHGEKIKEDINSGEALENPWMLQRFILLTYADLKSYDFIFWFAFPTFSSIVAELKQQPKRFKDFFSNEEAEALLLQHSTLPVVSNCAFFVLLSDDGSLVCKTLKEGINLLSSGSGNAYLCFLDPCPSDSLPGWPLRNLLALILSHSESSSCMLKVICLKIPKLYDDSLILEIEVKGTLDEKWVGWEKNTKGKYGPRHVNLSSSMDPTKLADSSASLNLQLMKWRLVPDLNLDIIKNQKCLLFGAGTLGCGVARSLMGWGVRNLTFVDSGQVSYSNPVRQSLFKLDDCGKSKAEMAATRMKEILPVIEVSGVMIEIPMPGHSASSPRNLSPISRLVEEHDILFLLTDSRESRWLPTLLGAYHKKIVITAALGFDTYLVMRHGIELTSGHKLGCYFCNDVTAPGNSQVDKTLDQQCTVTRPGVSSIASSLAVELMVSILQHPEGGRAASTEDSVLGILPHSIRGFLSSYSQIMPSTPAFPQCTACSNKVVTKFKEDPDGFLRAVLDSNSYLEDLTGLTELHKMTDELEEMVLSEGSSCEEPD